MSIQKNILLLIDVQEDFHDKATTFARCLENPSSGLPVVGSMNDTDRIITMLERDISCFEKHGYAYFDQIDLTMDSHLNIHIGHCDFWKCIDDVPVQSGVVFMLNERDEIVNSNKVGESLPGTVVYEARQPFLQKWAVEYIRNMISIEKIHPLIWNTHCIRNSEGWQIEESLAKTIRKWSMTTHNPVYIHEKGENILCEMYSVMKAVIPFEDMIGNFDENTRKHIFEITDIPCEMPPFPEIKPVSYDPLNSSTNSRNYSTRFNEPLFDHLCGTAAAPNRVYIGGQAKSHCVNRSVRDIVERIELTEGLRIDRIVILEDIMSNVVLPDTVKGSRELNEIFRSDGDRFIRDMISKGVRVIRSVNVFPLP
jgi:nicotinamidase-related amidase